MYGLPRPWYFPFQKSYWLGNGRTETWEWTWPWSRTTRLSVMEEDQACAMENRRLGKKWQWEVPWWWQWRVGELMGRGERMWHVSGGLGKEKRKLRKENKNQLETHGPFMWLWVYPICFRITAGVFFKALFSNGNPDCKNWTVRTGSDQMAI